MRGFGGGVKRPRVSTRDSRSRAARQSPRNRRFRRACFYTFCEAIRMRDAAAGKAARGSIPKYVIRLRVGTPDLYATQVSAPKAHTYTFCEAV